MQMMASWMDPLFVYNGAGATFPTGVVGWSDMGGVLVWFVMVAFVGSLLGLLRERTSRPRAVVHHGPVADVRLKHAA